MSPVLRPLFTLLVLLSVLTLGWMDARGMALPSQGVAVVICAEGGAKTVTLDAAGNPVEQGDDTDCAHCPDCLPTGAITLVGPVAVPVRPMRVGLMDAADFPVFPAFEHELRSHPARAPPIEV